MLSDWLVIFACFGALMFEGNVGLEVALFEGNVGLEVALFAEFGIIGD